MEDAETKLWEASRALDKQGERRTNQSKYRDDVIREALESGVTWDRVQDITGLSRRGIQLSLARTAK